MIRVTAVACLLLGILSSGCATRGSVRQVAADVKAVRAELALLRQTQEALSAQLGDLSAAAKTARATADGLQRALTTTAADVARVSARMDAAEEAIKQVRESLVSYAAAAAPPPAPPTPSPPQSSSENRVDSAENTYATALANFRAQEYGQAILDFLDVITRHPRHPLAPSAQFWIGEAYYRQHDYRQALSEFQKVIDWESPNPKLPDALVKAGLCYGSLREESRAQDTWRRVLREFPGSPAATEARRLLVSSRPSTRH